MTNLLSPAANITVAVTNASTTVAMPATSAFVGVIAGLTLTATSLVGNVAAGEMLNGGTVLEMTLVQSVVTQTASTGTYLLNQPQTVASVAMTSASPVLDWGKFVNEGTAEVFFALGGSAVTASVSSLPLPSGGTLDLFVTPTQPYVAAVTSSGAATLRVIQGSER